MSEKKYTVVLLNDGGITSEMINAINVVMGSFNMFLGGSESIRSDGSYILAKDVSEDIAYALKQGIEASGAYGHFPRPSGPRSPARQGHIKRPVLRLAEPSFLRPANQCC